jgi:hypothetical protein
MAPRDNFSQFDDDLTDPVAGIAPNKEQDPEPVPAADYEKIKQERDEANRLRDETIRGMLAGVQQNQAAPQEPTQAPTGDDDFLKDHLPDDVDPDVLALLTPVLKAQRDVIEKGVAEKYGHVAETVERDENLKVIAGRVDGFSQELLPEIKQLYDALPAHEREEYDNRLGIEILARRVLENKRGRSDMSGMAFSETPATPAERSAGGTTEQDIWDMPDEEFETLMHNVKMGRSR